MARPSRAIDRLPKPDSSAPRVKVVVASASRTATLGLYQALKILDYKPYHLYELVTSGNNDHWAVFYEGTHAAHDRLSHPQPRYTRADFDRWFAGYDAVIEVPFYFNTDVLEAYLPDPDVKFILFERSPESWQRSFNKFCGGIVASCESFPMNVLHRFNTTLNYFWHMNIIVYNIFSDGTRPGQPGNEQAMERNYARYIAEVKKTIPKERMLVCRLEDGLGWEKLCEWLGKEVPKDVVYPREVRHDELKDQVLAPLVRDAMMKLAGTVLAPVALGVGVWWMYGR